MTLPYWESKAAPQRDVFDCFFGSHPYSSHILSSRCSKVRRSLADLKLVSRNKHCQGGVTEFLRTCQTCQTEDSSVFSGQSAANQALVSL